MSLNCFKMQLIVVLLLVLGLVKENKCELSLHIIKNTEDFYTPVTHIVEEKVGSNFSLQCELLSSTNDNKHYDDQISWGKETSDFSFRNETDLAMLAATHPDHLQPLLHHSEYNKGVRRFDPLRPQDEGRYFCMSLKHMLFRVVQVYVKRDVKFNLSVPFMSDFCNVNMFKCHWGPVCIPRHYVCDGKADCRDQSDESVEVCDGDPCRDKLQCDDGRCIPVAWCCDRHHDLNCTVSNRPTCCQLLTEPYEEMEYGYVPYNIKHVRSNGARYLFISVCVLSSFFSVVLLLMILSKVLIFAKKSAYAQARNAHYDLDGISVLRQRSPRSFPCDLRTYRYFRRDSRNVATSCGGSNPLLVPLRAFTLQRQDQPPSYSDVVGEGTVSAVDPPPPYTSREQLNVATAVQGRGS